MTIRITRRTFLKSLGGAVGAVTLAACTPTASRVEEVIDDDRLVSATKVIPTTAESDLLSDFDPDVELILRAFVEDVSLIGEEKTRMLRYTGELLKGENSNLAIMPDSYLGPTIRVRKGQKLRIRLINELPFETITHWHGQHLPEEMDGHPLYAVAPGDEYIYEFEVTNRAGTYWYHPHPHEETGAQVYYGLAGLFIIEDEVEQSYALPHGQYDLPIVIQDRSFKPDKQLQYVDNPHQIMVGFLADTLLVNGRFDHVQAVDSHPHRLRLLNGSNARIYKLAWEDGSPITVIGTDGGLLEAPVNREYIMLAPAERLEVWVNFSGRENGFSKSLRALPIEGGNRQTVEVARFEVTQQVRSDLTLPSSFAPLAFHNPNNAVNSVEPRQFDFFVNHMTPTIDGRRFELDKAAPHETVKLNTLEIWELTNDVNGPTGFPHPIHIHGVQFQVLERTVMAEAQPLWETVKDGYVDEGWKDTVLLMPGERVKVLLKFEDYTGLFLYHCHNLEHEDGGMMRNYRVEA